MKAFTSLKLKYVADSIARGDAPSYVDEGGISVVNQACVWPTGLVMDKRKYHDPNEPRRVSGWLHAGDVLINSTGTGTLGRVAYVENEPDEPTFADGHVTIIRGAEKKFISKFLFYVLSIQQEQITVECSEGATNQIELSRYLLSNKKINWPEANIQQQIADFLDRETARIDTLITAKENYLSLIAEKRRALIISAVTRGIDPAVRLKDSGIPWLGPVPEHWETGRLAFLFRERDERNQPDLPLLVVSINTGVTLREFSDDRIESTASDFAIYKVARKGDVAFNKMRMWQGAVGVAPTDGLISPDYVVAEPITHLDVEYFGLLFRTPMFSAETARHSHGIVWDRLRLYWEGFRDIRVPLPPVEEQTAIVEYVQNQTAKLAALQTSTERTIALLRERRTALIAAAVTGKIKLGGDSGN